VGSIVAVVGVRVLAQRRHATADQSLIGGRRGPARLQAVCPGRARAQAARPGRVRVQSRRRAGARRLDHAHDVAGQSHGELAAENAVEALAEAGVDEVGADRLDPDQYLALAGDGYVGLFELEHLGSAELVVPHATHVLPPR